MWSHADVIPIIGPFMCQYGPNPARHLVRQCHYHDIHWAAPADFL